MHEYTKRRRELGLTEQTVADRMQVSINTYRRIQRGGGNIFEVACIRNNLNLPPSESKQTFVIRKQQ